MVKLYYWYYEIMMVNNLIVCYIIDNGGNVFIFILLYLELWNNLINWKIDW